MDEDETNRFRCVVLGGGLAGLYSAYLLRKAGHRVCVLEARMRVGGRVATWRAPQANQYAELGPEFIDSNHLRLLGLVESLGLKLTTRPDFWGITPHKPFGGSAHRAWRQFWRSVYEMVPHIAHRDAPWRCPESLCSLDRVSLREWAEQQGLWRDGEPMFRRYARNLEAGEPEQLSVLSIIAQESFYGKDVAQGVYRIVDGTESLPNALARALQEAGAPILLGAVVEAVNQDANGVRVHFRHAGRSYAVEAEFAIVALPFPILEQIEWRPELSSERIELLAFAGRGQVVRTLIQFRSRFWRHHPPIRTAHNPDITTIWEETDIESGEPGILSFWVGGAPAQQWATMTPDTRIETCLQVLEVMYPECRSQVIQGESHAWGEDPYAQHAYIFHKPGYITQALPVLREPEGRLFFAGDYLSLFVGYMEGALESAERTVQRVLARYNSA